MRRKTPRIKRPLLFIIAHRKKRKEESFLAMESCNNCGAKMESKDLKNCKNCGAYMCADCYNDSEGYCRDCTDSDEDYQ
jgi:hypothetical protein